MPENAAAEAASAQKASIFNLNDALLRVLFRHVVIAYPAEPLQLGWLIFLTHTCRRLRGLALDTPAVWAEHLCALPKAFPDFLQRARDAPLVFNVDAADTEHKRWNYWEPQKLDLLIDTCAERSAQLEEVSFVLPSDSTRRGEIAARFYSDMLDVLVANELPLLKRLDLSYTHEPTVGSTPLTTHLPFIAPQLVSLRLSHQPIAAPLLYDIIRGSPLLQSLHIDWPASDLLDIPPSQAAKPLDLPDLMDLTLSARDFPAVLAFWKLLEPHRNVRMTLTATAESEADVQRTLTALTPMFYRQGLHNLAISTRASPFHTFKMLPKRASSTTPHAIVRIGVGAGVSEDPVEAFLRFLDASWIDGVHLDLERLSPRALAMLANFDTVVEMGCALAPGAVISQLAALPSDEDPVFPSMGTLTLKCEDARLADDALEEAWRLAAAFIRGRAAQGLGVDYVRLTGPREIVTHGADEGVEDRRREIDCEGMKAVGALVQEVLDVRV